MASMKTGTICKIGGYVKRSYCNPAGTFAAVTIDAPDQDNPQSHAPIIEAKCFSRGGGPVEEIKSLRAGQKVIITCKVNVEKLKDDDGEEIKVKGRAFWYPVFIVTKVEIESSSIRQEQKPENKPADKTEHEAGDEPDWAKGNW